MTSIDNWSATCRDFGALYVTRPDFSKQGIHLSAYLPPEALLDMAQKLKDEGFTLLTITTAEFTEGFVVSYLFDSFTESSRLALRVLLKDKEKAKVPSLYSIYQGAEWHERESYDFFGLIFEDNPNLVPLLLPHDLAGPPPLRKAAGALSSLKAINFQGKLEYADPDFPLAPEPQEPAELATISEAATETGPSSGNNEGGA
ncbi:MAG: NADH-quinone oxidoreductase subunit C [Deltaproteobacteria bacterium]|jgi:NADH-quinone oxidoreductase subunit C|nr:NADH-quinone oxidoreductase subunit C [Deltaproteobacteria bacterium]